MIENNGKQEPVLTSAEESARIAKLTAGAITTSSERVIEDVKKTIETVEQQVGMLRLEADNLVEEIRRHTKNFAERVTTFVENCHGATMMVRNYQAKLGDMPNGVMNFDTIDPEAKSRTDLLTALREGRDIGHQR